MIDRCICDQTQGIRTKPLPKNYILVHYGGMKFCFLAEVEDLQRPLIRFERDDLLSPMHNSAVSLDRSSYNLIVIL